MRSRKIGLTILRGMDAQCSLNLNGGSKPKAKEFSIKQEFHDHKWIFMAFTSDFVKDEEMSFFKEFTNMVG